MELEGQIFNEVEHPLSCVLDQVVPGMRQPNQNPDIAGDPVRWIYLTLGEMTARKFSKEVVQWLRRLVPEWNSMTMEERRDRVVNIDGIVNLAKRGQYNAQLVDIVAEDLKRLAQIKSFDDEATATPEGRADGIVGWNDETRKADHWFSLPKVGINDAAMLLCGLDPDMETLDSALNSETDETGPDDLRWLLRNFQAHAQPPSGMTLNDWYQLAVLRGWKLHSWVGEYIAAKAVLASNRSNAPWWQTEHRVVELANAVRDEMLAAGKQPTPRGSRAGKMSRMEISTAVAYRISQGRTDGKSIGWKAVDNYLMEVGFDK